MSSSQFVNNTCSGEGNNLLTFARSHAKLTELSRLKACQRVQGIYSILFQTFLSGAWFQHAQAPNHTIHCTFLGGGGGGGGNKKQI
jgi:hypothetical protein